jgi:CRP-like cAMP-binding protein
MNATLTRKPTRDPQLIEGVLANLLLMEGVSRGVVQELSTQSKLVMAKRGDAVVRRGGRVPGIFALAYGALKKRLLRAGGGEVVVALVRPGETFAEAPALLGCESKVDAVALADSMLVVINATCLSAQAQIDPRLARNLAHALARRVDAMVTEIQRGTLPGVQRLAAYLDSIAEPGAAPEAWVARLPMSKTLLAARLDIKKETLSRLLRELAQRGLVSVARHEIRILDRRGLTTVSR